MRRKGGVCDNPWHIAAHGGACPRRAVFKTRMPSPNCSSRRSLSPSNGVSCCQRCRTKHGSTGASPAVAYRDLAVVSGCEHCPTETSSAVASRYEPRWRAHHAVCLYTLRRYAPTDNGSPGRRRRRRAALRRPTFQSGGAQADGRGQAEDAQPGAGASPTFPFHACQTCACQTCACHGNHRSTPQG
jgi:hypothetical protein